MTFDPTSIEVTSMTLPNYHCVQVLGKYIKVYGYSDEKLGHYSRNILHFLLKFSPIINRFIYIFI